MRLLGNLDRVSLQEFEDYLHEALAFRFVSVVNLIPFLKCLRFSLSFSLFDSRQLLEPGIHKLPSIINLLGGAVHLL